MSRIAFDTEFMEDGEVIVPLSLGFVHENGRRLYIVITDTDRGLADPWVAENVVPHLDVEPEGATTLRLTRSEAAGYIVQWAGPEPEFWADYASYDWVLLCQLFGRMVDLPDGWPMFVRDFQQDRPGVDLASAVAHNALADADCLAAALGLSAGAPQP